MTHQEADGLIRAVEDYGRALEAWALASQFSRINMDAMCSSLLEDFRQTRAIVVRERYQAIKDFVEAHTSH